MAIPQYLYHVQCLAILASQQIRIIFLVHLISIAFSVISPLDLSHSLINFIFFYLALLPIAIFSSYIFSLLLIASLPRKISSIAVFQCEDKATTTANGNDESGERKIAKIKTTIANSRKQQRYVKTRNFIIFIHFQLV
jgi:hypothetical protein